MAISDFVKKFFEPTPKLRARDVVRELPGATKKVAKTIFQAPGRASSSVTLSLLKDESFTPSSKIEKFFLGREPTKSLEVRTREATKTLANLGVPEKEAKVFAPIGIIGLTALDLYPGSAGKGKLLKDLAVETTEAGIKTLLRRNIKTLSSEAIETIAPRLVKTTDSKTISAILKEGRDITSKVAKPSLPPDLQPLTQEARKKADIVFRLMGNELEDINIIGSTARGKAFPNDLDILITPKNKLPELSSVPKTTSESFYRRLELAKVFKNELQSLFPNKKLHITIGDFDIVRGPKMALGELNPLAIERGFISSAKEVVPTERIAGQYIPRATDELAIKAKNLILDNPAQAEKIAMTESDDKAVAVASELLKKYADDAAKATDEATRSALYDKAAEVANTLAPKLTEQGRSIQAASILGRLTPEGQIRFAAREIQRYNETVSVIKRIPELTGRQAKFITEEMKVIQGMSDGVERAMRFQKLQNFIKDLVPTPLMQKLITVWKAGLLTGFKTQGLNIFSNLFHGATEVAKDIPAAIIDSAASLFTGTRTKTFTVRKIFEGLGEGLIKGKRYFSTGFDERNIAAKLDYRRVNFGKGPVAKVFQTYTDTVFRFLGAQDQPFYYGALSRSLMDQALAQGKNQGLKGVALVKFAEDLIQKPTEEMIRYGVADATTAVFQNKTALGEAARGIQRLGEKKGGGGVPFGEIVLPFGRTPSAVAMQILNYSPVGIAKTIIQNIGKGNFDQRLFSQGVGRGLTGIAILAIGMELAQKGLVALDYPQGDEREQELQKAEGVKNNSIKVDDEWRSPIVLGPAGNILLIGAHFQKALEEAGSPTETLSKAALGSAKSFTEQTFLTGIQNAVNAVIDPERYAKSYLPGLVASFVPTVVSDVSRATDPLERRPEGFVERIKARIPGLRQQIEPQVDILGRERESVGNPLEILFDPTRPSLTQETPVTEELRRLMDTGFRVSPTVLGDRQGFDALSKNENTRLWKFTGDVVNDKLTSLFSKEQYEKLADDEKAKTIEKIVDKAKIIARAGMAIKLTEGLSGEELKKKLAELKKGGLLTREVYNMYLDLR